MQAEEAHVVRLLDVASGTVSALAGLVNTAGNSDGVGSDARFSKSSGVTIDEAGTFVLVVRP